MSFMRPQVNFLSKFALIFSIMTHNSSALFQFKYYILCSKGALMSFLRFLSVGSKFSRFLMSFFKAQVVSSSNFASFFSVMTVNYSLLFWFKNNIRLTKVAKQQIFRLATARIKIHQIPHVIFGIKSQFFFKLCITLQCRET